MAARDGMDAVRRARRRIVLLLALLAAAVLVAVLARTWQREPQDHEAALDVPLLRADPAPIRQRPDEPGGMTVPYQDVLALHELGEETGEPVIERLLEPPEAPLPKPTPPEAEPPPPAVEPAAPSRDPAAIGVDVMPDPAALPVADTPSAPRPDTTPPAVTEPEPAPAVEAEAPDPIDVALSLAAGSPPAGGSRFVVQLGAYLSRQDADAGWKRALARAPEVLEPVRYFIAEAEPGSDTRRLYRLRIGPLPSGESAASLCRQLERARVDCFVVAP